MIHKIIQSNGDPVLIESDEDLVKFLKAAQTSKLVMTKHGVVNPSFVVQIVPHRELNGRVEEMLGYRMEENGKLVPQYTRDSAERQTIGVSPYAKLLGERMGMLSAGSRTAAQEEAAAGERRLKS